MNFFNKLRSKSSFKLDLSANLAGMGWYALVQFICIPFYVKFLGVEGYGLVGFYITMQAILQVLDLGITPTINRELARYTVRPELAAEARDLVRTIELSYCLLGALVALLIVGLAPFIASHWIHAAAMSPAHVQQAVMAMGVLLFFQWLVTLHQAALLGLHHQVFANVVKIAAVTISSGGGVLVVWLLSATATSLFLWQSAIAAFQAVMLMLWVWHSMPPAHTKPRFNFGLLRGVSGFAAGMSGISISAIILTQLDKVILSRICTLEVFGYYVLAGMFGRALLMFGTPVFDAIFPRFSALVAAHEERTLDQLYHRASQVMAVLIIPLAVVLAMFSGDLLLIWTHSPEIVRNAAVIACVLSIGAAINALMIMPYTLQLAYGWTGIGLKMNLGLMVALVPAIWILTSRYGGIGAASAYLALTSIYMAMGVPLTHRRLLKGATAEWFLRDIGSPAAAALLVGTLGRLLFTQTSSLFAAVIGIGLVFLATLAAAVVAAPLVREWILAEFAKIRPACV